MWSSALITNPFRDTTIAYRNHPNQHTHPRICDACYDYPFRDTQPDSQLRTVHCDITLRYLVHQHALRYPPLRYNPIIPSPPATSPPRTLSRSIPPDNFRPADSDNPSDLIFQAAFQATLGCSFPMYNISFLFLFGQVRTMQYVSLRQFRPCDFAPRLAQPSRPNILVLAGLF